MLRKTWSVRTLDGNVELELGMYRAPMDDAARAETRRLIRQVTFSGDQDARRVVLEICAALRVGPLPSQAEHGRTVEAGSASWESFTDALMRAADVGAVIARQRKVRRVGVPVAEPSTEALGPESETAPEPDIFVLAAEVKLIGDTPLIRHEVRVLDPDTGEVVADGLMTDENGIVRTEVPAKKTYRIEIVDHDPDVPAWRTISTPHPMLRCVFVDLAGAPVPDLDVKVKDLDGHTVDLTADENGLLEMPMHLGLYEVIVEDASHLVHSLLHSDGADDAYEIVVHSKLEDGQDGIDPDDRLTRSWEYHGEDDDDGDVA